MKVSLRMKLVIDLSAHFLSTVIVAVIVYLRTASFFYAGIVVMGGIFIDLDHLIDYFCYFKNKFSLKNFFESRYFESGKVFLFFHSWELNFIIFASGLFFKSYAALLLSESLSMHLVIDNILKRNKLCYFFLYRYFNKFNVDIIMPEAKEGLKRKNE